MINIFPYRIIPQIPEVLDPGTEGHGQRVDWRSPGTVINEHTDQLIEAVEGTAHHFSGFFSWETWRELGKDNAISVVGKQQYSHIPGSSMGRDFLFSLRIPRIPRILKKDKLPGRASTGGRSGHMATPGIPGEIDSVQKSSEIWQYPRRFQWMWQV